MLYASKTPNIEVLQRRYQRFCNWYIVPDIEDLQYRICFHDIKAYFKPSISLNIKGWISMSILNRQVSILNTIWTPLYWRCNFNIEGKASVSKTQGPSQWRLTHSRNACTVKGHLLCDFRFSHRPSRAAPRAFINGSICCGVARHSPCVSPRSGPATWRPWTSSADRPRTGQCRHSR